MLKSKIIITALFITGHFILIAQTPLLKFGEVPIEELKMKIYDKEPKADAIILAKTSELAVKDQGEIILNFRNFFRLKILNKSAFNYGNVDIDYIHYNGSEFVSGIKAMITYPDGSKYRLKKKDFQKYKLDNYTSRISFYFPKLEEGSVIEYEYKIRSNDLYGFSKFDFQYDIPVKYASFQYIIPRQIDYQFETTGEEYIHVGDQNFSMYEVPSMEEGPFITTMKNYRGNINLQILGTLDPYIGYYPIASSWQKICKDLDESEDFGQQFQNSNYYDYILRKANPILEADIPIKDKILKLQTFILDNVQWDYTYGIFTDNLNDNFRQNTANSGSMNLMMVVLLKAIGIKAVPMLIGLRENGKIFPKYAVLEQFTHVICYAEIENKPFLIDLSDKYMSPGNLRISALNEIGLIYINEGPRWIQITPNKSTDVFLGEFYVEKGQLIGKIKGKYDGYSGFYERKFYENSIEGSPWKIRLRKRFPRAVILNSSFENLDSLNLSFIDEANVEIPGAALELKDSLIINPFIYNSFTENPFKMENRKYPVNFGYPFSEQFIFQLHIPEGYTVGALPEQTSISNEDRTINFLSSAVIIGNNIQVSSRLNIDKIEFAPMEIEVLSKIFGAMIETSKGKIVLLKN